MKNVKGQAVYMRQSYLTFTKNGRGEVQMRHIMRWFSTAGYADEISYIPKRGNVCLVFPDLRKQLLAWRRMEQNMASVYRQRMPLVFDHTHLMFGGSIAKVKRAIAENRLLLFVHPIFPVNIPSENIRVFYFSQKFFDL